MAVSFARFTFTHRTLEGATVRLGYRLSGDDGCRDLEETFTLPAAVPPEVAARGEVQRALAGLHHMAGVSYWKAALSPDIDGRAPAEADRDYFTEAWSLGLGEFFCRNGLDPNGRVRFPAGLAPETGTSPGSSDPARAWVLLGGGKDSVVSVEAVRRAGLQAATLSVGSSVWIARAAQVSGLPHTVIRRRVDPQLHELHARGAPNGHVPISAILAHAALLLGTVTGVGAVVASNERSASFGNVAYRGIEVNHQWSKGIRFERLLRDWCDRHLPGGPRWFSLLRPLSELAIARCFARHPRWFDDVTSCNANFRLDGQAAPARWCGHCPKCVFVYAVTSPFLDDGAVARLFGRSFLAEAANVPVAAALCGVVGHKPFECVGTPEETRAALWLASKQPRERETPVVRWFGETLAMTEETGQGLVDAALAPGEHALDARWEGVLRGYLDASR